MKRLVRIAAVVAAAAHLAPFLPSPTPRRKEQSTRQVRGHARDFNLFARQGRQGGHHDTTAVKGNRKATMNDTTGQIIDLSEEKVYDLNIKKKEYTVTTFEEIRKRMRRRPSARRSSRKRRSRRRRASQKPQKEYEVDFDVKETGQKKQIAGYDTHETIVTDHRPREGQDARGERRHRDDERHVAGAATSRRSRSSPTSTCATGSSSSRAAASADDVTRADGAAACDVPARRQGDGAHAEGRRQAGRHAARHDHDDRIGEERGADDAGQQQQQRRRRRYRRHAGARR